MTPAAFAQFHCCVFGAGESAWLPVAAWSQCKGRIETEEGARVWLGVDIGGSRANSALVGVAKAEDGTLEVVICETFQGDDAPLMVTEAIKEVAQRWSVMEVAFDSWRYKSEALRLEDEHGLVMLDVPQSSSRMVQISEGLHKLIVERGIRHPGYRDLDRSVAAAVAKPSAGGRGWRLDKSHHSRTIDSLIALSMAASRATAGARPTELLGWL